MIAEFVRKITGNNPDPHKAERDLLFTLADLPPAIERQKQTSRDLEAARLEVASGAKWPGYLQVFAEAFAAACGKVDAIKRDLDKRKELAPVELRERYRRLKKDLMRFCARRKQLLESLAEHDRDHAKLTAAVASAKQSCSVAATGDSFSQRDAASALQRAEQAVAASQLERDNLVEQIDETAQGILEAELAVSAANNDLLTC